MAICQGCENEMPDSRGGRARKWCSERCRKVTLYAGECVDCGWPTNGYNGREKAAKRCRLCRVQFQRETARWTRETAVTAIQKWADEHGGIPPTASQWKLSVEQRGGAYPSSSTVQYLFDGSWHDGIAAAGFDAFTTGHYGRDGEMPEVLEETVRLYRTGLSLVSVAEVMGTSDVSVWNRLKRAGEPRRGAQDWRRVA